MAITNYDVEEDTYIPSRSLNKPYASGTHDAWAQVDRGYFSPTRDSTRVLVPGVYCFRVVRETVVIKPELMYADELYALPDSVAELVSNEFAKFCGVADRYRQLKLSHRRNILLYGPQGAGKTSTVMRTIARAVEMGYPAFQADTNPEVFVSGLRMFRALEPGRICLVFMEDIDALIDKFGEQSILSLLDGESQVDGTFIVATTNFPEKLNKRIVNRPRRFDRVIKVKKPDAAMRRQYIEIKLGLIGEVNEKKINGLLEASDGLSFSAMTELIISTEIMDIPLDEARTVLRKLEKGKPSSDEESGRMGFD